MVDIGDGLAVVFKMESHNHPSFIEPLSGRGDGRGRHPARRVHHGRAAHRGRSMPLRFGDCHNLKTAPPAGRRGGRHRRLWQFLRRCPRWAARWASTSATTATSSSTPMAVGPREDRRDLLRGGHGRRPGHRLSRLQDRPRRHPRRHHGLGRVRRGMPRRSVRPCRWGDPLRREAAAGSLPRNHAGGLRGGDPGHGAPPASPVPPSKWAPRATWAWS